MAPTWFVVLATDTSTSCSNSDSVFINVAGVDCDSFNLFIPNAFTPNTDGNNDDFSIFWRCPFQQFNVKIFNRWGEKVFESNDQNFKWDGTYKGALQNPAVFVYLISAVIPNGRQWQYKGSVTLIR
jgi:gliding motility-associated-like protein